MKKILLMLGAILFASAMIAGDVFAYNYINSTSFVRMPSRAATISTVDAVFYNPAGLVKIPDGFYTELGNNFIVKNYSHKFLAGSYTDSTPVLFSMFGGFIYKSGKGSLFIVNYVPEGGGMSDYRNKFGIQTLELLQGGVASLTSPSYVHAYRFWVQIAMGGAYALSDSFAVTAGLTSNIYYYDQSFGYIGTGCVAKETTRADGFGGWLGFLITPVKQVNFSIKYAPEVIARGKITDKKMHYSQITEARLPAYLAIGLNVKPHEKVELQASYQLSFTQQKAYGNSKQPAFDPATVLVTRAWEYEFGYAAQYVPTTGSNIVDYKGKLTHAAGVGVEVRVHEKILVSCGVGYENAWLHPRAQNPFDPKLASVVVGLGGRFKATDKMDVDIGILKNTYFEDKMLFGLIKMKKNVWVFSIDLSTKWM
ncbi:MAG: hypothetical protein A2176_10055 [Spirochaetes bacterium RBG_13_51_14]|nr:MAG: hypothetical protein A2176_10055 [Spirochaetes bacterium RBG_13_51_14]